MPNTFYLAVIALVLSVFAMGCAGLRRAPERPHVVAQKTATAAQEKQRRMLNEGYSMLYTDGKERASYFAPLMGHSGREYERTVLIGLLNGINHESHLCQVMSEAETDAGLKKFLIATGKRYNALYGRTMKLLDEQYFSDPFGASAN